HRAGEVLAVAAPVPFHESDQWWDTATRRRMLVVPEAPAGSEPGLQSDRRRVRIPGAAHDPERRVVQRPVGDDLAVSEELAHRCRASRRSERRCGAENGADAEIAAPVDVVRIDRLGPRQLARARLPDVAPHLVALISV